MCLVSLAFQMLSVDALLGAKDKKCKTWMHWYLVRLGVKVWLTPAKRQLLCAPLQQSAPGSF